VRNYYSGFDLILQNLALVKKTYFSKSFLTKSSLLVDFNICQVSKKKPAFFVFLLYFQSFLQQSSERFIGFFFPHFYIFDLFFSMLFSLVKEKNFFFNVYQTQKISFFNFFYFFNYSFRRFWLEELVPMKGFFIFNYDKHISYLNYILITNLYF